MVIKFGKEWFGIVNGEISLTLPCLTSLFSFLSIDEWILIKFCIHIDIDWIKVGIRAIF